MRKILIFIRYIHAVMHNFSILETNIGNKRKLEYVYKHLVVMLHIKGSMYGKSKK